MDTRVADDIHAPEQTSWLDFVKAHFRDYGMLLSLLVIMLFFQVVTNGTLLRPLNLTNLVLQNSYIVIMALGMLLVIVAGHIDLSVGSIVGFVGGLAAMMMVRWGFDAVTTTIVCLIVGGSSARLKAIGWPISRFRPSS
jgi:putative multiple sugar transport system permease protein